MYTLWAIVGAVGLLVTFIGAWQEELSVWMIGMKLLATAAYFMAMHAKKDKEREECDDREPDRGC